MSDIPTSDAQAREHPDPHEKRNPVPALLLLVVGAVLAWAMFYIFANQRNDLPELGDSRTAATLQAAAPGATGAVDGAQVFAAQCAACHQASGLGLPGVFPPLAGSEWVLGQERVLVAIVLHGISGALTVKGNPYGGQMPAFKDKLNDAEIAAVLTHVRSHFGNDAGRVSADAVKAARAATRDRNQPWNGNADLDKLARP